MAKSNSKRKTRSDKFPLTLHPTGQYCKKIKSKLYYFRADNVPQVRGGVQFYPSALEKGCRSERTLKLAIAEMYVQGVSTRRVTDVLEKMCGLSLCLRVIERTYIIVWIHRGKHKYFL